MNHFLLFTILLFTCATTRANLVVIECTFPCSQDNEVCEVSNYFVKCKPNTSKTKWILKDTSSLPEYQGPSIDLGQTCLIAPHPKLKDASHLSTNSSESTMNWPPDSIYESYDSFYSNCGESMYCDRANICAQQLPHGSVCESDNQCYQGMCHENTCQKENTQKNYPSRTSYNTIHIILTVLGIALFIGLLLGAYVIRRRKRQNNSNKDQVIDKEQQLPTVITTTKSSNTNSRSNSSSSSEASTSSAMNHHVTNILHPDYESTFVTSPPPLPLNNTSSSSTHHHTHNHTPSRQQQVLQLELQRQLLYNQSDKSEIQPQTSLPPPPYSP